MFEIRRCVVPTNKLRPQVDDSCIRYDTIKDKKRAPSISCLLGRVKAQANYNRESGKV